jgi:hypothetical protein
MTALSIQPPFPLLTDIDGQPLEDGYIWIGVANLPPIGNPIAVYWDAALTQPAGLPVRTRGGYPVNAGTPARLYVNSDYSIQVQNKNGSVVYSAPQATERLSADLVTFIQSGSGAVVRTAQSKMRDVVSVLDFGAVGDGVADDTVAIQAAIDYTYTKPNNVNGKQLGGIVFLPKGRYLIKTSLVLPVGITIQGEPSGLASVSLSLNSSGSQIVVSATLANGSPWNNSAAFTIASGGPITIRDIAINGTQTVTTSRCVYLGDGTTNVGITQGHFENVRFVGFTNVFYGTKMFDCSFYDCGFESNTNCFNFFGGTFAQADTLKFVSCIFFEGTSSYFQISGGAVLEGVVMSACIFQQNPAVVITNNVFNIYDATLEDVSIVGCCILGQSGDTFVKTLSATSGIQRLIFSGNTFTETDVLNAGFQTPVNLMYDIVVSNNTLNNSSITADYEVKNLVVNGNVFRGSSVVSLSQCNSLSINGNDFSNASTVPPIALTDIFTTVSISNNLFSSSVTSIPINASSTRVKMIGNVYFADVLMP